MNYFSTYRLCGVDENGRTIRRIEKLSKIKQIGQHFNIQVANPVTIMPQETTKKFLREGQKTHYTFFFDGTMLTGESNTNGGYFLHQKVCFCYSNIFISRPKS